MMREILFRGKDPETGMWYVGQYIHLHKSTYCFDTDYAMHPDNDIHQIVFERMTDWCLPNQHLRADVDPHTVGQYTGLNDKNGKRIFEGDICRFREWSKGDMCWVGKIHWEYQQFVISGGPNKECNTPFELQMSRFISENIEIIGNIHDNPEMIEEKV